MALLPFTLCSLRIAGNVSLLSLCLLSSCVPRISQLPAIPPPSDVSHGDPARDAHSRLLKEAYRAFVQERYSTAILYFQRFTDDATESPRLAEAHWWLGRAYEQVGDYRAAMAQYRMVAAGQMSEQVNGTLYEGHALRRLDQLRQLRAYQLNGQTRQLAFRVGFGQIPPQPGMTKWLHDLAQGGVTSLVVELLQTNASGRGEFGSESTQQIVSEAHRMGLSVWVALDVHRAQGLDLKPEWLGKTVSGPTDGDTLPARPDIANPKYQAYLEDVVRSLSRKGYDGLFLPARSERGFAAEFSEDSFREFSSSFGLSLSPRQMLTGELPGGALAQAETAAYWRWVGWKAISYATLAARLRKALRETNPTATVLVEVHRATLTSPVEGLEQYGEDIVQLLQRTSGSMLVRLDDKRVEMPFAQLEHQLGTTDRFWIGIPAISTTSPPSAAGLKTALSGLPQLNRWNILVMTDSAPPVP